MKDEMDALPSCEELNKMYPRTKSLDEKVYAVIKREARAAKRRNTLRMFSKIAAGFCVFAVIGAGVAMTVEASRNFILNLFVDIREDYVAFDFGVDGGTPASAVLDEGEIILGYKPEGFKLVHSNVGEITSLYVFTDDADRQIIVHRDIGRYLSVNVDYEYLDFTEIQLGDTTANLFVPLIDGINSKIMWVSGEYVISIITTLDSETLVRIAENIVIG